VQQPDLAQGVKLVKSALESQLQAQQRGPQQALVLQALLLQELERPQLQERARVRRLPVSSHWGQQDLEQ
jgi:hypothetical protein